MSSLSKTVGRMLCIGFEGQECGPELRSLLTEVRPGGIILFQRNISSEEQFRRLIADIRDVLKDSPPYFAIDQEGGQVDRFRELLGPLPSAREAAQAGLAFQLGDLAGRELAAFGLHVDFAPVVDLGSPEAEPVLGTRTAGNKPQEIIQFAREFLRGLSGWNITGCGKHFPGLGGGRKDSHVGMPVIEKSQDDIWNTDLQPYKLTALRYPMIMMAHAWYPALETSLAEHTAAATSPLPASLSPAIIQELLRRQIGHMGLVVSDDLEMGGVLEGRTMAQAACEAVRAGCEVLPVCRRAEYVARVHTALVFKAERESDLRELIVNAAERLDLTIPIISPGPTERAVNFADLKKLRHDIAQFAETVLRSNAMAVRNNVEGAGIS